jgi:hypothetical protein
VSAIRGFRVVLVIWEDRPVQRPGVRYRRIIVNTKCSRFMNSHTCTYHNVYDEEDIDCYDYNGNCPYNNAPGPAYIVQQM